MASSNLTSKQIAALLDQGLENAIIYLNRGRLEQRLSILEENNLFISLKEIKEKLELKNFPRRIECYDISHLSGTYVYGSMITFVDGWPAKKFYKLFKTKDRNDDFANHQEVMTRRIKRYFDSLEMLKNSQEIAKEKGLSDTNLYPNQNDLPSSHPWALPDLMIIDGGKGQLSATKTILDQNNLLDKVDLCSLAKRIEEIFTPHKTEPTIFSGNTLFLLQRIRDEAHRFAITANREARLKASSSSELDDIIGVGPKTKLKLLQTFGSVKKIIETMDKNPELLYELVGKSVTQKLKEHFG